ncbi:MAG: hypothetical protein P8Y97_21785 [Candidatus Lokiarchaeota archaeon]
MAISNHSVNLESLSENLTCDICDSDEIIETQQGYVCKSCGIVLEVQKLIFNYPRNEEAVHYSPKNRNQIGYKCERLKNKFSRTFNHINKLNTFEDNEERIRREAKIEVKRIFEYLELPKAYMNETIDLVLDVRSKLAKGTKYRNIQRLVPVVIYISLKLKLIPINQYKVLEIGHINKKDFNAFKLQIYRVKPEYIERNRKEYVIRRIFEIREHFELDMEFYNIAVSILEKMWGIIKNTTDDVIAGLVSSIVILCNYQNKDNINVSSLCQMLGIRMSTIQSQVKGKIFQRLKIPGFQSLVRSSDLLKTIMEKLGFLQIKNKPIEVEPVEVVKRSSNEISDEVEIEEVRKIKKKGSVIPEIFEIELANYNNQQNNFYIFALDNRPEGILIIALFIQNRRKIELRPKKSKNSDLHHSLSKGTIKIISLKNQKGSHLIIS